MLTFVYNRIIQPAGLYILLVAVTALKRLLKHFIRSYDDLHMMTKNLFSGRD